MPEITARRKRPVTVRTLLWDGHNQGEMQAFCGLIPGRNIQAFMPPIRPGGDGKVWNEQESCWINVPAGHHVVGGPLGEFYPISPDALAETYEPLEATHA